MKETRDYLINSFLHTRKRLLSEDFLIVSIVTNTQIRDSPVYADTGEGALFFFFFFRVSCKATRIVQPCVGGKTNRINALAKKSNLPSIAPPLSPTVSSNAYTRTLLLNWQLSFLSLLRFCSHSWVNRVRDTVITNFDSTVDLTYQGLVRLHQLNNLHRFFVLVHLQRDFRQPRIVILLRHRVVSAKETLQRRKSLKYTLSKNINFFRELLNCKNGEENRHLKRTLARNISFRREEQKIFLNTSMYYCLWRNQVVVQSMWELLLSSPGCVVSAVIGIAPCSRTRGAFWLTADREPRCRYPSSSTARGRTCRP